MSAESTHDERRRGSTTDLRKISGGPPIVVLVVSRALFWHLFFVLFDLFGLDGSFLVLMGEGKVSGPQRR